MFRKKGRHFKDKASQLLLDAAEVWKNLAYGYAGHNLAVARLYEKAAEAAKVSYSGPQEYWLKQAGAKYEFLARVRSNEDQLDAENYEKAARAYEKGNHLEDAARVYRLLGRTDAEITMYTRRCMYLEAAIIYEKQGEMERVARMILDFIKLNRFRKHSTYIDRSLEALNRISSLIQRNKNNPHLNEHETEVLLLEQAVDAGIKKREKWVKEEAERRARAGHSYSASSSQTKPYREPLPFEDFFNNCWLFQWEISDILGESPTDCGAYGYGGSNQAWNLGQWNPGD